jgi:hypothetical protein
MKELNYNFHTHFKDGIAGNYLEGHTPAWLRSVIKDEYSPFHTMLDTIDPPKDVELIITLRVHECE